MNNCVTKAITTFKNYPVFLSCSKEVLVMLPQIDYHCVQIYQSPLERFPQSNLNPMLLPPSSWLTLFKVFGLFLSAELGMEALVWLRCLCALMPRVPLPLAHLQPAIPISDTVCPEKPHTSPVHMPFIYGIHKFTPHQGPRKPTLFIGCTTLSFQTHPFLAPSFEGPCISNKSLSGAGFRMSPNTWRCS